MRRLVIFLLTLLSGVSLLNAQVRISENAGTPPEKIQQLESEMQELKRSKK